MFFAASNKDLAEIDPLRKYLQVMTAIGTGGFIFAKTCGRQFILVVHTEAWASESCVALLQAYCLYCAFMALNGISEAYAYSKGNEATMATLRRLMVINTICYISLSLYLSQEMGVIGLVYANCANMLLRSIACLAYTFKQYKKSSTETILFFVSIFSGKIYLGLVALALGGCLILQHQVIPFLFPKTIIS